MRCIAVITFLASAFVASAGAQEWPSFRGPEGTGICTDQAAPLTWDDKVNVKWHVPLPNRGNSTPAVWGDRVFVTQALEKEKRRLLLAFDARTGKELWRAGITQANPEPTNRSNPYCAASPATDGQRVVAFFGTPGLYCYDMAGKELWHRALGELDSWHGSGSSPILHGGLCYMNFGPGTQAALYAVDVKTGEIVWKTDPPKAGGFGGPRFGGPGRKGPGPGGPRPPFGGGPPGGPRAMPQDGSAGGAKKAQDFERAGTTGDFSGKGGFNGSWCTPVVLRTGERDELIMVEMARVAAYDPKTGKLLWSCNGLPPQVFASPAIGEGVLVAMGHNIPSGTKVMAVKLGGTGDVSETHRLWETNLRTESIGSGIIAKGCVFLVTQHGIGLCLDLKTGKKLWEERLGNQSGSWSSLLLVNDRLLIMNQSGQVSVLRASPKFERLHTNTIPEETTCSSLAIAGGRVFLRTYENLWCFGQNAPGGGDGNLALTQAPAPPKEAKTSDRKKQVVELLKSIETGDPGPAAVVNPKKYIQHNLAVGDGIEGFAAVLKLLPKGSAKAKTVRVFQDGNFVFTHTEYDFFGPKIGFDVFRFEDGKITEHWDNLQETPKAANPSKHTMTDGPTEVKDQDKIQDNKALVRGFVEDVLVGGNFDRLAAYFEGDNYVQHNPLIADGLSGLGKALESMKKAGITMQYEKVHRVLGEGNFVLVLSEGKLGGKHVAFYDLFRVEYGKIAEHWDTIEEIPARKDWKNNNGRF